MCFTASSLNPFPPVVCVFAFCLRKRLQTTLVRKTDPQYPGSPREHISGDFGVIMVDLQMVSIHPCKVYKVASHRLQEDSRSFRARHLL